MRKLLVVLLGLPMVLLGILVHKYKPYPYPQFVWLYRIALINFGGQRFAAAELSKQYSHYTDKIPMDRFIESGVLPLQVTGVSLSESHAVPRIGGAITAIDDTVVILDRLGNVYAHALAGETRKLPLPPLPNNVMDYLRAGLPLDADVLRAYNVKYIASAKLLVVSHEAFDRGLTTRMAVSVIQIDGSLDPVGTWKTVFLGDAEPYGSNQDSGGALAVDDQGGILLTIGDYKLAKENHTAPDGTPKFGKIVHINAVTQEKKTLSIGHRNPQGLLIQKTDKSFPPSMGRVEGMSSI